MDISKVTNELYGLIGWRPDFGYILDDDVVKSTSNLVFNNEHPLVTLDNMFAIAPDFDLIDYPSYDNTATYYKGTVVLDGTQLWEAVEDVISDQSGGVQPPPLTDDSFWIKHDPFSSWIRKLTKKAISKVIIDWGVISGEEKIIFTGKLLGEYSDTLHLNNNKICGIKLKTKRSKSLSINVRKIYLQFEKAQDITINVYKLGTTLPIKTEIISYTNAGDSQEFDFVLDVTDGDYYFSYDQSLVDGGYIGFNKTVRSRYFSQRGFYCSNEFKTKNNVSSSNFGLDLDLDISCDFTKVVIEQKNKFIQSIMKKVTIEVLQRFIFNPSALVNRNESNFDDKQILYEIDGSTDINNSKLGEDYKKSLKSTILDFSRLDKVCHKCRKKGVNYTTV